MYNVDICPIKGCVEHFKELFFFFLSKEVTLRQLDGCRWTKGEG